MSNVKPPKDCLSDGRPSYRRADLQQLGWTRRWIAEIPSADGNTFARADVEAVWRKAPWDLIYRSTILNRGWTRDQIRRYLGEPDQIRPNPHHRSGRDSYLYFRSKVDAVELTQAWQAEWSARALLRR